MQALIAIMGILVTALVVAGMILMAPGGAEQDADRGTIPVAVPLDATT